MARTVDCGGGGDRAALAALCAFLGLLPQSPPNLSCTHAPLHFPPPGTGPLEDDERLLAAAGAQLPPNQRHALLYRMGQKRLARAYLVHAKELLQQAMAHLARLQRDD